MGQSQLFVHASVETFRAVDGVTGCRGSGFSSPSPVLLLSAMDRHHIVSQFKQRERVVVIIDPAGTYYLSPLLQFEKATDAISTYWRRKNGQKRAGRNGRTSPSSRASGG